mmetsp:Transcript_12049/g.37471  ORF Transcript_12049/g.37471 Transcript_12049/m.37471 type:complete len:483 (+) Transcript_12049:688-2136(+)
MRERRVVDHRLHLLRLPGGLPNGRGERRDARDVTAAERDADAQGLVERRGDHALGGARELLHVPRRLADHRRLASNGLRSGLEARAGFGAERPRQPRRQITHARVRGGRGDGTREAALLLGAEARRRGHRGAVDHDVERDDDVGRRRPLPLEHRPRVRDARRGRHEAVHRRVARRGRLRVNHVGRRERPGIGLRVVVGRRWYDVRAAGDARALPAVAVAVLNRDAPLRPPAREVPHHVHARVRELAVPVEEAALELPVVLQLFDAVGEHALARALAEGPRPAVLARVSAVVHAVLPVRLAFEQRPGVRRPVGPPAAPVVARELARRVEGPFDGAAVGQVDDAVAARRAVARLPDDAHVRVAEAEGADVVHRARALLLAAGRGDVARQPEGPLLRRRPAGVVGCLGVEQASQLRRSAPGRRRGAPAGDARAYQGGVQQRTLRPRVGGHRRRPAGAQAHGPAAPAETHVVRSWVARWFAPVARV